ncbi:glycosyltransferase family 2 protein [Spirochaeta cellobiosiphila]|uniref:glycosyltransferase family 2 protein n=1 Tax=Spirochaeta cellobiosiphila TaxID=504483 RepID=UPI0003F95C8E|nr:glycosyltransferase family 2 protein [Spirochaeta cellobiosiphila]
MLISVCIPVYNGANTISSLVDTCFQTLEDYNIEIVLVNDCSKDNSDEVCTKIAQKYSTVKYICLRRNYSEHNAVMCALNHCEGDVAVIIDDDFQNPPSEIIKLVDKINLGFDVVYSKYHKKKHHFLRNWGSKLNDITSNWLLNKPKDLYLSSFKAISRDIINEIVKYKGPFPYIDGLILRVTNNITSVYVDHKSRAEGESNYTIGKLINLWLNMFINFSIKPMRFITFLGIFIAGISGVIGVVFIIEKVLHPEVVRGWTSLVLLVLFFGGIQNIFLGIIGEYIGKNYLDLNGTPQWVIKNKINVK